jgi:hypothetical protein
LLSSIVFGGFLARRAYANSEAGQMKTFSIEAASEMPLADDGGYGVNPTLPPLSPPDEADDESEMRRWTADAFARATPTRRPLFGS